MADISITAADVAEFLGHKTPLASAALEECVNAVLPWVNRYTDEYNAPDESRRMGAILMVASLYKRRSAAGGYQGGDGAFVFVPRYDADVERLLGLNKPRIG